ncbi:putative TAM domain methyltransferase [Aulographum hederae CBS 113979]|uniref:Putative TAM domain methyltransferase n=1 Tax=Aulographum hederae CBS 113979 TaxID=1176131 RepID=A0A6G1H500_9PEZI|nr:putative TAM domain methyltransferase [Aulographum hederae CBS 113979]
MSTRSLRESVMDYIKENGRTYHAYQAGSYLMPNDTLESERLDMQYYILKVLFGSRDIFAPLNNPKKILDVGTGTGKWAVEIAAQYPNAEILGTDLSPIQPQWVPDNVKFIIDDAAEDDWMIDDNTYDYVHTRALMGSFADFRHVIAKAYKCLKPGAYMGSEELFTPVYCDDGTMPSHYLFKDWLDRWDAAVMDMNRPLRIANKLKRWYQEAGFVDVREEVFKLPINPWPKDPQLKLLGRFHEANWLDGLQGFSLAPFHRGLGWTKAEIEVYLVNVRKAIQDRSVHGYQKVYVVWGRKPFPGETEGGRF